MKTPLLSIFCAFIFSVNAQQPFTKVDNAVAQLGYGSCSFGDLDKDGDADLLLTGEYKNWGYSDVALYRNDNGSFTRIETSIRKLDRAVTDMADVDNDGDVDIILGGGLTYIST